MNSYKYVRRFVVPFWPTFSARRRVGVGGLDWIELELCTDWTDAHVADSPGFM